MINYGSKTPIAIISHIADDSMYIDCIEGLRYEADVCVIDDIIQQCRALALSTLRIEIDMSMIIDNVVLDYIVSNYNACSTIDIGRCPAIVTVEVPNE